MRVLFISYTGLAEPLGRSQILPYLAGLASSGHRFLVMSFEKKRGPSDMSPSEVRTLLPPGVDWIPLPYHKTPTVAATFWDIMLGIARGLREPGINMIHARSTVPAAMAWVIATVRRLPWIFDVRGYMAKEYVDAGHWPANSMLALITDAIERRLLARASGLVYLTSRAAATQRESRSTPPIVVIPCAVDLDRFRRADAEGRAIRDRYGLGDGPLMTYAGSLGSWYLPSEMLDFLAVGRSVIPDLRFLVLTPHVGLMETEARRRGLSAAVHAVSVLPAAMPAHLSAADFGISFVAPSPSKAASSPTKIAEYLACGLPVVSNAGVGDVELQARGAPWVVIRRLCSSDYHAGVARVQALLRDPGCRAASREAAQRLFSLDSAVASYLAFYQCVAPGQT
jgi:glycosyltransferase involved in cell wall biosynthesis